MGNAPKGPPPPSGDRIVRCKELFMREWSKYAVYFFAPSIFIVIMVESSRLFRPAVPKHANLTHHTIVCLSCSQEGERRSLLGYLQAVRSQVRVNRPLRNNYAFMYEIVGIELFDHTVVQLYLLVLSLLLVLGNNQVRIILPRAPLTTPAPSTILQLARSRTDRVQNFG